MILAVISKDRKLIDDINLLMTLFPRWETKFYDDRDKAWIEFTKEEPDLSIYDTDISGTDPTREGVSLVQEGKIAPLLVFVSTNSVSLSGSFAVTLNALDYIQKPVNLDRIVFAMSIAQGPVDEYE